MKTQRGNEPWESPFVPQIRRWWQRSRPEYNDPDWAVPLPPPGPLFSGYLLLEYDGRPDRRTFRDAAGYTYADGKDALADARRLAATASPKEREYLEYLVVSVGEVVARIGPAQRAHANDRHVQH